MKKDRKKDWNVNRRKEQTVLRKCNPEVQLGEHNRETTSDFMFLQSRKRITQNNVNGPRASSSELQVRARLHEESLNILVAFPYHKQGEAMH